MTIFLSPVLLKHINNIDYAQNLLEYFVNTFTQIYDEQYVFFIIFIIYYIFVQTLKSIYIP